MEAAWILNITADLYKKRGTSWPVHCSRQLAPRSLKIDGTISLAASQEWRETLFTAAESQLTTPPLEKSLPALQVMASKCHHLFPQ